jgi:hypothetical protein
VQGLLSHVKSPAFDRWRAARMIQFYRMISCAEEIRFEFFEFAQRNRLNCRQAQ